MPVTNWAGQSGHKLDQPVPTEVVAKLEEIKKQLGDIEKEFNTKATSEQLASVSKEVNDLKGACTMLTKAVNDLGTVQFMQKVEAKRYELFMYRLCRILPIRILNFFFGWWIYDTEHYCLLECTQTNYKKGRGVPLKMRLRIWRIRIETAKAADECDETENRSEPPDEYIL